MAGRKVFTSGEILTAADVNSYLMDQSVMVFADSTARSSAIPSPSEGMVTYLEDANQVQVYDGSAFGPIGGILQVVSATKTDTFTTSSTSMVDIPGLSVSITPSSTSSKILVISNTFVGQTTTDFTHMNLVRDSTPLAVGTGGTHNNSGATYNGGADHDNSIANLSLQHLDSPNSTSALTYKLQMNVVGGTMSLNRRTRDNYTITGSSITVMEVAV